MFTNAQLGHKCARLIIMWHARYGPEMCQTDHYVACQIWARHVPHLSHVEATNYPHIFARHKTHFAITGPYLLMRLWASNGKCAWFIVGPHLACHMLTDLGKCWPKFALANVGQTWQNMAHIRQIWANSFIPQVGQQWPRLVCGKTIGPLAA